MTQHDSTGELPDEFLAGVVEGFYGRPWTQDERFELFDLMGEFGLDTYFYAAKDDPRHRACWRDRYTAVEADDIARLIHACRQRSLRFVYGLAPGLDIRYGQEAELTLLRARFEQLLALGCQHFALLFDDIPDRLDAEDLERWGSLAKAQCHVANTMQAWLRQHRPEARFLFCPTAYCGRMSDAGLGGSGYLSAIGESLSPAIDVLWTGPEIVSREIAAAHLAGVRQQLRRKPILWDNLHANDYDGRRFYCGPYSGRPLGLRDMVKGVFSNPNNELPLNYVPLRTLSEFLRCEGDWNPRRAYLAAVREWQSCFATTGRPIDLDDLILFCDCHYLPYEDGDEAAALYAAAHALLTRPPAEWDRDAADDFRRRAVRLRDLCARMTELSQRPLFHALFRRVWELREELDLLERYVAAQASADAAGAPFRSDFHQAGTYRGGLVARLQRLLVQEADGSFVAAASREDVPPDGAGRRRASSR